jgi:hypothetical protein
MMMSNYINKLCNAIKGKGLKGTVNYACRAGAQRAKSLPIRLKSKYDLKFKLPSRIKEVKIALLQRPDRFFQEIRCSSLEYIESNRKPEVNVGAYSYKPGGPAILYASCYAALTRHLYNDFENISDSSRHEWISYIQSFQMKGGLFHDPVVANPLAEEVDWWGWRHLTLHALMALITLGGVVEKPFDLLRPFKKKRYMSAWLKSRNWQIDPASVSNEIQNIAVMLQYTRDVRREAWCDDVLREMYDWLDTAQDPETGLWGTRFDNPVLLSHGVQTGYHLWLLYFYDHRPIRHIERIIDSCLATQNVYGGFGVPLNSSACEDIDSIDPMIRFSFLADYRKQDIRIAMEKAFPWILANINPDGGWVFRRHAAFRYGHEQMRTAAEEGAMFPTWFRTLTLAYLGKVLVDTPLGSFPWTFLNGPGLQFWQQ